MKRNYRIPTLLALGLLFIGVMVGIFLLQGGVKFFSKATITAAPQQVTITNVGEDNFTVSWITESKTVAYLRYGTDKDPELEALDSRDQATGQKGAFLTHYVSARGLQPSTKYYFEVVCGTQVYDNNNRPYEVTTAPVANSSPPTSDITYGLVLDQTENPIEGIIVYLTLANTEPLSSLTNNAGSWFLPLNSARSVDLKNYAQYDLDKSLVEIYVQGGSQGTATAVTTTGNDSPVPTIILGRTFDFRSNVNSPVISPTPTQYSAFMHLPAATEAENDLPSFSASPSATIVPSPTVPVPTPTLSTPRSGNLTPTLLFFIMGGGALLVGVFLIFIKTEKIYV